MAKRGGNGNNYGNQGKNHNSGYGRVFKGWGVGGSDNGGGGKGSGSWGSSRTHQDDPLKEEFEKFKKDQERKETAKGVVKYITDNVGAVAKSLFPTTIKAGRKLSKKDSDTSQSSTSTSKSSESSSVGLGKFFQACLNSRAQSSLGGRGKSGKKDKGKKSKKSKSSKKNDRDKETDKRKADQRSKKEKKKANKKRKASSSSSSSSSSPPPPAKVS